MTQALIAENADLVKQNRKYIMQITGDNNEGKQELDNFTDVEKTYPEIVTTSKLLTTGVDAQTCKMIVLDANISSSTEFKQIIGRGTRIREDLGKTHFTILDFRKATDLFSDPNFDGYPIQIKEIKQGEEISDEDELTKKSEDQNIESDPAKDSDFIVNQLNSEPFKEKTKTEKIYVDNVEVSVVYKQKQFLDENGKLITVSFKDFSKKQILKKFSSLDDFINKWSKQEQKIHIIQELENQGIDFFELQNEIGDIGKNIDPFDLILHIAFGKNKLITRQERVNNIRKKNYLAKYSGIAKNVLENLLEKYDNQGLVHIEDINILTINPFNSIGSPIEIIQEFGGREAYFLAVRDLESEIYSQL
jgi:type I restriction enzyme R subunit